MFSASWKYDEHPGLVTAVLGDARVWNQRLPLKSG